MTWLMELGEGDHVVATARDVASLVERQPERIHGVPGPSYEKNSESNDKKYDKKYDKGKNGNGKNGNGKGGSGGNGGNGGGGTGGPPPAPGTGTGTGDPQVQVMPLSGVATGDGSTSSAGYMIGALALTSVGGAAAFNAPRVNGRRVGRHAA
jgi:hypothetical protein